MQRILFQGDSITDAGRWRGNDGKPMTGGDNDMGIGYPTLVGSELGFEHPNEYEFLNRGIGGNRVIDLMARIKADIINLEPDVMSILIGVNDAAHDILFQNGVAAEKYEKIYSMIIEEVKAALPDIKIMILEPFALPGEIWGEQWEVARSETEKRAAAAERVAKNYGLTWIPLMKLFDAAAAKSSNEYWLRDGVHPTAAGHELIKREWIKAFMTL